MASDSNMGSHQASMPSYFHHPLMVSFQSGAIGSLTETIPGDICSLGGNTSMASVVKSVSSGMINHMNAMPPARYPAVSVLHEPTPRFKHVSGSPAYWSPEEVEILNVGLVKYSKEIGIRKYTKIAAMLPQKTIRDVALRRQWMIHKENGKRRKMEEYYAAKKMKDMKDNMVDSPSTANIHRTPNSLTTHCMNIHDQLPSEVPTLDAEMKRRLDENDRFLKDIARNLEGGMIEENTSIFHYMRNNISKIEDRINVMLATVDHFPGSMRQMPVFPVSVNDELLSSLIPLNGNVIYTTPGSNHLQLGTTCFRPNIR